MINKSLLLRLTAKQGKEKQLAKLLVEVFSRRWM